MAQQFSRNLSLTSDNVLTSFGFRPTFIRIDAATAGTAYLSFTTAVATTNSSADSASYQLTSGVNPLIVATDLLKGYTSQFNGIAATGSTTVIRILAVRI